ncbi:MAG TPA: cation diffusion facilitator family transporter [Actinomycetes bacterium]|nr:cation diffusion facilitator family transporter [Actinomycetes bacterium]
MSTGSGTRAIIAALLANLGIALTKFIAYLITNSASMLAESVHSVADSGNQALLLLGGKRAQRGASAEHPFGYGRDRYIYAFIVSIVLFSLGGLFALWEGFQKLANPHPIERAWVALGVLIIAIVLESISFRTAIVESNRIRGTASWVNFIRRAKAPELPVVLLEDFGALIGLVFALMGVSLAVVTGDSVWDAIGSLAIGSLLVSIAIVLATETKSLLVGEAATRADLQKIEAALLAEPEVRSIIHMRTMHLGPDELLVAVKIAVDRAITAADLAAAIDRAEARIRAAVPIARVIYIEPDIRRATTEPAPDWSSDQQPSPAAEPASGS